MMAHRHLVFFADHRPRLNVGLRTLMALFGGYGLALLAASAFALGLPLPRVDAVQAAIMLAFLVHLVAAIWIYAAATLVRAAMGLILPAGLCWAWLQWLRDGGVA